MKRISQLMFANIYSSSKKASRAKTPDQVGPSLFKALLKNIACPRRAWGENDLKFVSKERARPHKETMELFKPLCDLGAMMGWQVKLTPALETKLRKLLELCGIQRDRISSTIKMATDKEGNVDFRKIIQVIARKDSQASEKPCDAICQLKDVPQIGQILFRMGFTVEEVNGILEASSRPGKGLDASKLGQELSKRIPAFKGQKDVEMFLSKQGINISSTSESMVKDPELSRIIEKSTTGNGLIINEVREQVTLLLKKKGIQIEDIKKFLETLSIKDLKLRLSDSATVDSLAKEIKERLLNNSSLSKKGEIDPKQKVQMVRNDVLERQNNQLKEQTNSQQNGLADKGRVKSNLLAGFKHDDFAARKDAGIKPAGINEGGLERGFGPLKSQVAKEKTLGVNSLAPKTLKEVDDQGIGPNLGAKTLDTSEQKISNVLFSGNAGLERPDTHFGMSGPTHLDRVEQFQAIAKIMDHLRLMIKGGQHEAKIKLSPPELGEINIKIVMKDGNLHAHLGVDHPWVKEMIDANIHHLRESLNNMGFNLQKFETNLGAGTGGYREHETALLGKDKSKADIKRNIMEEGGESKSGPNVDIVQRYHVINVSV